MHNRKQLWQNLTLAKKLSSKERLQKGGGEGRQKRKAVAAPSNKVSRPATAASCATAAAAASVMSLTLSHKKFDATSNTTLTLKEGVGQQFCFLARSSVHLFTSTPNVQSIVVTGSWVTNEEGGGDWTIDASGKTTYDNKDYGSKYYIKEDPTGALRRGDGWVSGPNSTGDRLIWTFKNKKGVVWVRRNYLQLHQGGYLYSF